MVDITIAFFLKLSPVSLSGGVLALNSAPTSPAYLFLSVYTAMFMVERIFVQGNRKLIVGRHENVCDPNMESQSAKFQTVRVSYDRPGLRSPGWKDAG